MILSNQAIVEALNDGRLSISPAPPPLPGLDTASSLWGTTTIDLTLGDVIQVPRLASVAIDPRQGNAAGTLANLSESHRIDPSQGWELRQSSFCLGQTRERIHLKLESEFLPEAAGRPVLAARVEGKSSLARYGLLIHFTAPTIHAGFEGPITLEIINLGAWPIRLYPGLAVCQLVIEQVEGSPVRRMSQFQGQQSPAGTRHPA